MPEGILIDYNDGRPVMAITAGLRAPSFCTSFSGWSSQPMQYPVYTPLVPGSQVIVIPTNPVYTYSFAEFDVAIMTGVTRNGGKRAARTVLTGMRYSIDSATRQGSSSLTRFIGQSAMTLRT